jgi:phospholipase A1
MDRQSDGERMQQGHSGAENPHIRRQRAPLRLAQAAGLAIALGSTPALQAQALAAGPAPVPAATPDGWQACTGLRDAPEARLACFDQWAGQQPAGTGPAATATAAPPAPLWQAAGDTAGDTAAHATRSAAAPAPVPVEIRLSSEDGCRGRQHSELSRFWELEAASTCDTFGIRGYRPISLSVIGSTSVNTQPTSANPLNNATSAQPYETTETRIQLSVRTKIAQGLLTQGQPTARDSLWFGYTQQSYWQLFNGGLSRPFRVTDHEPEFIYVYPTDARLPGGWRLRYSGLGVVHQSNGQALPLSRSWNRVYLMSGMEHGNDLRVQARVWARLPENRADDDNPEISNTIGRAELAGFWNVNRDNTLALTLRHSLRATANGSVRLEWLSTLGSSARAASGLRFHTQLFSGYGDSLLDYNRRRTVLSIGLSLVDF